MVLIATLSSLRWREGAAGTLTTIDVGHSDGHAFKSLLERSGSNRRGVLLAYRRRSERPCVVSVSTVIDRHSGAGRFFSVSGIRTFALDTGAGPIALCFHGVPTSSFLYRRLIPALSEKGMRGVCFDFPGLGLTDRPADFDYSFHGLLEFAERAVEAMNIAAFHLVVHDIGGPIGFALAGKLKHRVLSITVLNTWIDVEHFRKPLPMRPFGIPVLGEIELAMINRASWYAMFSLMGVSDRRRITKEEVFAYVDLLKREDGGRAFLKIMRGFDYSRKFSLMCRSGVEDRPYEIQAIWGAGDPGLTLKRYGSEIAQLVRPKYFYEVRGKHLLQEDQYVFIAQKIAERVLPAEPLQWK